MTQWFDERYMSRSEHQEIIEYYRKLVAQLHRKVRELRTEIDASALAHALDHRHRLAERQGQRTGNVDWSSYGPNIIALDLRRCRKSGGRKT